MGNNEKNEENDKVSPLNRATFSFSSIFSVLPPLNRKSRFSRSETLKKSEVSIRRADIKFFFNISDLDFRFKGGKHEKNEENEKVALFNGETL